MIIWLSSYPKSGNTWVRAFLSSLLFNNSKRVNFDDLKNINIYPRRTIFKKYTNNFNNIEELSKFWIPTQEDINKDNKIRFLKTHHATCKIQGHNFTNTDNTLGRIYIVRDPRNVISSYKYHFSIKSIEESFNVLSNKSQLIGHQNTTGKITKFTENQVCTFISSWSHHYNSWKINWGNNLLIKYENLVNEPEIEFGKIRDYLEGLSKSKISEEKFSKAINENSFKKLKMLEKEKGFSENAYDFSKKKTKKFFYKGPENNWEKVLKKEIIKKIEKQFHYEMRELEYL